MASDDYRSWLVEAHHASVQAYDKAVMTLAGGALGISIAFVRDLAPQPRLEWALATTWALLATSLFLIFVSFATSQQTLLREIEKIDGATSAGPREIAGPLTEWLNWSAGGAFVSGLGFLVAFAFYNV